MNYSKEVKEGAKATADYLRQHGWKQGEDGEEGGPCCAYKAMDITCSDETVTELKNVILKKTNSIYVFMWNDKRGRTQEEVLALFDEIAA